MLKNENEQLKSIFLLIKSFFFAASLITPSMKIDRIQNRKKNRFGKGNNDTTEQFNL